MATTAHVENDDLIHDQTSDDGPSELVAQRTSAEGSGSESPPVRPNKKRKRNATGQGKSNITSVPKRAPGRPPKIRKTENASPAPAMNGSDKEERTLSHSLSLVADQTAPSDPTINTEPSRAVAVEQEPSGARSAGAPVTWRGGLNGPLAQLMAEEYGKLLSPPAPGGKMAIYREWASKLGISDVDHDGSRVRKGVTRLIKEFEKAYSKAHSGRYQQHEVLEICPQFNVLLPVLHPEANLGDQTDTSNNTTGVLAPAETSVNKRKRQAETQPPHDRESIEPSDKEEAADAAPAAPQSKRARYAPRKEQHGDAASDVASAAANRAPAEEPTTTARVKKKGKSNEAEKGKKPRGRPRKPTSGRATTEGSNATTQTPQPQPDIITDDEKRARLAAVIDRLRERLDDLEGPELQQVFTTVMEAKAMTC
jgi:hypothetical protein